MTIQSVAISVNGVSQTVSYNGGLQAYVATLPQQSVDLYQVEIDATDVLSNTTTYIAFLSTVQGEIVQVAVNSSLGSPVPGVQITAYYASPVDGSNYGRAETQTTATDGTAYLHLNAGVYNLVLESAGFVTKILNNFQVISGINVYGVAQGGTVVHTHVVNNQGGVPVAGVSVKIEDLTIDPRVRLVASCVTDSTGTWTATLVPAHQLAITFEKQGLDFQKVVIPSA